MASLSPIFPIIETRAHFQPVYVGDVADAVMRVLTLHSGDTKERIFSLGGPQIYSWREMMEEMLRAIGRDQPPHRPAIMTIPFGLAMMGARLFGGLPHLVGRAGVTRDQILLLSQDNVVPEKIPDLSGFRGECDGVTDDFTAISGAFPAWRAICRVSCGLIIPYRRQ